MKRFAAAFLLISFPALAQPAEKTYTLTVNDAELQVISDGLGELPAKRANPLIVKLQGQVSKQIELPKAEAKPDVPKK